LGVTLNALEAYKGYRDAVVHAKIFDPRAAIAPSGERKGKTTEVMVSKALLKDLHERLEVLAVEAALMIEMFFAAALFRGKISPKKPTRREKLKAAKLFREYVAQLLAVQKFRQSLPPLPELPEESPSLPELAGPKAPRD
jgi:hypothetical protein